MIVPVLVEEVPPFPDAVFVAAAIRVVPKLVDPFSITPKISTAVVCGADVVDVVEGSAVLIMERADCRTLDPVEGSYKGW